MINPARRSSIWLDPKLVVGKLRHHSEGWDID
jgi:hypothetical protein